MTLTQKLLSVVALGVLITISSCKDDEGSGQLSKEAAKGEISEFNAAATDDLNEFADADGVKAIQEFFDLVDTDDPFGRIGGADKKKVRAFFHEKGREFKSIFVKQQSINGRTLSDEPFDYEANLGVYAWNPALGEFGQFEKIAESTIIVIQFPTEGSPTNNAELRLTAYSEVEIYDEEFEEYSYEPAILNAAILVNQQEVASLDLTINWDELGFPLSGEITLEVAPFAASISFDDSNATSSTLAVSFTKNQEVLVSTSVTANYSDDSKSEESLKTITGFVQFRNLKLEGTVDVEASNETEVDWNKVIDVSIYSDGQKLGDIIIVDENEEGVFYVQYADGSTEKLETVLQPVIDEIEELTEELDDNG